MPNPVPAVLLTRFATELTYQGQGLGQPMLRAAAEAVKRVADAVGVACLLVHAKDDDAKSFYFRFGASPRLGCVVQYRGGGSGQCSPPRPRRR